MKRLLSLGMILLASMGIVSCGGGGNTITGAQVGVGAPEVATIELIASSPQLPSDKTGESNVTITAIAKDENNNVTEDVAIIFSSDSGALQIIESLTSANGIATALLSNGGDPTNRTIIVTATDGTVTSMLNILVVGTVLTIFSTF